MAPDSFAGNPYIGTRPFRRGETLYGRNREARDLFNLLIAERIILLYSPSGAGKTSLLQAALIPALLAEGFRVLPVIRVSQTPPPGVALPPNVNRYVYSVLLSLEDKIAHEHQLAWHDLAAMTLQDYLDRRAALLWDSLREQEQARLEIAFPEIFGTGPYLTVFDQFEEILTVDPTDQAVKVAFFEQVGAVLQRYQDLHRAPVGSDQLDHWALFAMREDYIAAIEPYVRPVPTRLQTTFRLEQLDVRGALEAIQQPALAAGVEFSPEASQRLVDDLRQVKLQQADGTTVEKPGPFVEPVQLQVVCRRLWDNLAPETRRIEVGEVAAVGEVSRALGQYYADSVHAAAEEEGVRERAIRDWIEEHLISPAGIRTQVLQGHKESAGLKNEVITALVDVHLLRGENRHGVYWFELAHDRLIAPIRNDNAQWREDHLSVLQRSASLWDNNGRPDALLLRDDALQTAREWAKEYEDELGEQDHALLAESERAHAAAVRDRRMRRLASIAAIIALLFGLAAVGGFLRATASEAKAVQSEKDAIIAREAAVASKNIAVENADLARLAEESAKAERIIAEKQKAAAESQLIKRLAIEVFRSRETELDKSLLISLGISSIFSETVDADASLLNRLTDDLWLVTHLRGQDELLEDLAFGPTGLLAASGRRDGSIVVWDTASPFTQPITLTISPVPINVSSIAWAHRGNILGFGDGNGRVGIWRLDPQPTFEMLGNHNSYVSAAIVSPDDRLLATGSCANYADPNNVSMCSAGEIRLWSLDGSAPASSSPLIGHQDVIADLAFHPTLPILASTGCQEFDDEGRCLQGEVLFWDLQSRQQIASAPLGILGDRIRALAYSPDGTMLAAGSEAGRVVIWTMAEGSGTVRKPPIQLPRTHVGPVDDLAFSEDGALLASSSCATFSAKCAAGDIYVWEVATSELAPQLAPVLRREIHSSAGEIVKVAFHNQLLAAGSKDGQVILRDLGMRDTFVKRLDAMPFNVNMVAFSPSSRLLAIAGYGEIRIIDLAPGQELASRTLTHTEELEFTSVAFSPDDVTLAAGDNYGNLWRWTTDAWTPLEPQRTAHDYGIAALAYQPKGHLLATAGDDPSVVFWDTTTPTYTVAAIGTTNEANISSLAFTADGSFVLSGGDGNTMSLWDMHTLSMTETLTNSDPGAVVKDVAASAFDKQLLASAPVRGAPYLWDLNSLQAKRLPNPQEKQLSTWHIAFSPQSPLLVGGTLDGRLLFWDTKQARTFGDPIQGHDPSTMITDVAISPDGRWLASSDDGGTVLLWPLDIAVWRQHACQMANRNLRTDEWAEYFPDRRTIVLCPAPSLAETPPQ